MRPIYLEVFPLKSRETGTASELLEEIEHAEQLLTIKPCSKAGKKQLVRHLKCLKQWKIQRVGKWTIR